MKKLLTTALAFSAASMISSTVWATPLTLENPGSVQYQQTLNSPCVIGENSCKNPAGFGEADIPNTSSYDVSSPYLVSQVRAIVGNLFFIGIDVNTTTKPLATEFLVFFKVFINGVLQFDYTAPGGGTQLQTVNNGNGNSDEILKGFNLTAFNAGDTVTFEASVTGATDGKEQFFLIDTADGEPCTLACTTVVPEPATLALLGSGLVAISLSLRRRKKA